MPSHLAAGLSGPREGVVAAPGARGGTAPAVPAPRTQPEATRRSRRAASTHLPPLPVVPDVPVLLPDARELLAADDRLGGAPLVSPRAGRRRADAPVDAPRGGTSPAAAAPGAGAVALPRQRGSSSPAPRGSRRAETGALAAVVPAPRAAADVLPPAPTAAPATPPQVAPPMTRRARREVEQLEAALALPALDPDTRPAIAPDPSSRAVVAPELAPHVAPQPAPVLAPVPAPVVAPDADEALVPAGAGFEPSRGRRCHRHATRPTFGLPQVGVVGVLGLATMVVPMVGQVAHADADTGASGTATELAVVPAGTTFDVLAPVEDAAQAAPAVVAPAAAGGTPADLRVDELLAKREQAEQASRAIGERTVAAQAEAARLTEEAAALEALAPGCDGVVPESVLDAGNGRLDPDDLCPLWESGDMLRADAALALAKLDLAYRAEFGEDIQLTDSYRSYASQVAVKRSKPGLAARPGTSQHGWGLAVDLGGGVQKGDRHYDWLAEHAGDYGWENPAWAQSGGSGPYEPWHWEYAAGRDGQSTNQV